MVLIVPHPTLGRTCSGKGKGDDVGCWVERLEAVCLELRVEQLALRRKEIGHGEGSSGGARFDLYQDAEETEVFTSTERALEVGLAGVNEESWWRRAG
jgi:hypothetical protein